METGKNGGRDVYQVINNQLAGSEVQNSDTLRSSSNSNNNQATDTTAANNSTQEEETPLLSVAGPPKLPDRNRYAINDEDLDVTADLPEELRKRLNREGAKSGDIQVSLIWNGKNDLDLHLVTPGGERIYHGKKRSRDGGILDVDMNAGTVDSLEPVENIYWPQGQTPSGKFTVYVNHYRI